MSHAKNPHHARATAPKTKRAAKANKRAKLPPYCVPINRDHAREHERKSEFCFEVGNEARNPPRRRRLPIKYWGVACAQVAKKPNRKACCVNRPAEAFGICNSTPHRFSAAVATSRAGHREISWCRSASLPETRSPASMAQLVYSSFG